MEPVVREGERLEAELTAALERGDFAEAHRGCTRKLALAERSGTPINSVAGHEPLLGIDWAEGTGAGALAEGDAVGAWSRRAAGEQQRAGLMHYWWSRAWILADAGRAADAAAAR